MKRSPPIFPSACRQLHSLLNPAQHGRVRRLWYALMVSTLLAAVLFIFLRAENLVAPELLTKLIYVGPIPAVVIVWIYGRLHEQS